MGELDVGRENCLEDKLIVDNKDEAKEWDAVINDCRNCKHGHFNDYWEMHFCYNTDKCVDWNLWEPVSV